MTWDEPGVAIRRATEADLGACLALFHMLHEVQGAMWVFEPWPDLAERMAERYQRLREDPGGLHLVAEEGGQVVGMAIGEFAPASRASDERVLDIGNVVVLPSHRGRGIARELVEALKGFARDRDVRWLALRTFAENEPALHFWQDLGFRPRVIQLVAPVDEPLH